MSNQKIYDPRFKSFLIGLVDYTYFLAKKGVCVVDVIDSVVHTYSEHVLGQDPPEDTGEFDALWDTLYEAFEEAVEGDPERQAKLEYLVNDVGAFC